MESWCAVAELANLIEGRGTIVERGAKTCLAVFLVGGQPYVLENRCPHRNGDLGAGDVANGLVYCPLHAWPFELESGRSPTHPSAQVRVFPSRIRGTVVEAELSSEPAEALPKPAADDYEELP